MTRAVILTALAICALAIFCLSNSEHAEQFPLVQAAAPSCLRPVNPCDTINCRKVDTKRIA